MKKLLLTIMFIAMTIALSCEKDEVPKEARIQPDDGPCKTCWTIKTMTSDNGFGIYHTSKSTKVQTICGWDWIEEMKLNDSIYVRIDSSFVMGEFSEHWSYHIYTRSWEVTCFPANPVDEEDISKD